ncbi:MAG: thiamine phosphate synthase [Candidatus Margulisiibacteriota bacterium]
MNLKQREARFNKTTLYPVITPGFTKGRSVIEVLEAVLAGGARVVQLRDQQDPARYAAEFRRLTERYGALLIINDSLETALKYKADGIHLGQNDLNITDARRLAPELLIGFSANSLQSARAAMEGGASYIAVGPIFSTLTKPDAGEALGVETLKEIRPAVDIPLIAIGGINYNNIKEVLAAGVRHLAMITALTEAEDINRATREFLSLIQ